MSILYVNPGFSNLFADAYMPCYETDDEKFTKCKHCVLPLDYQHWYRVYASDKITNWNVRFDVYANLMNKTYTDFEGFLRISNIKYEITLALDSLDNLVVSSGGESIFRTPFEMQKLNSYEFRFFSPKVGKESIQLFKDGEKIFDRSDFTKQYFKNTQPTELKIKNVVYLPNKDNYRHGIFLSNFIVGDSRLGNVTSDIIDTVITTDWNDNDGVYTTDEDGKTITQKVKNADDVKLADDECIYCVSSAMVQAKSDEINEKATHFVDDSFVNENIFNTDDKRGLMSDVIELNPIEAIFWDKADFVMKKFKFRTGGN